MQLNMDITPAYPDSAHCDLRLVCGPRYNSFGPAPDRREEPAKFFQRSAWKTMAKLPAVEDETERWDGLE